MNWNALPGRGVDLLSFNVECLPDFTQTGRLNVAVVDDMCRDLVFLPVGERLNTRVELNTRTDLDIERACQEECS